MTDNIALCCERCGGKLVEFYFSRKADELLFCDDICAFLDFVEREPKQLTVQ